MNQTAHQAAEKFSSMIRLDAEPATVAITSFLAGWAAGQPKWIPVTERLPEDNERYLCITEDNNWIVGEYEHNYIFCDASGCSWRCRYWCSIPNSLLNSK